MSERDASTSELELPVEPVGPPIEPPIEGSPIEDPLLVTLLEIKEVLVLILKSIVEQKGLLEVQGGLLSEQVVEMKKSPNSWTIKMRGSEVKSH